MSRQTCFYCHAPRDRTAIELDHFPIPKRHGGTTLVPACQICHTVKDRMSPDSYPPEFASRALEGIISTAFGVPINYVRPVADGGPFPPDWDEMPYEARIFFAKLVAITLDMIHEDPAVVEKRVAEIPGMRDFLWRVLGFGDDVVLMGDWLVPRSKFDPMEGPTIEDLLAEQVTGR